jgi:hypothetical protein
MNTVNVAAAIVSAANPPLPQSRSFHDFIEKFPNDSSELSDMCDELRIFYRGAPETDAELLSASHDKLQSARGLHIQILGREPPNIGFRKD